VALADQAFGTYVDLVLVQSVGADAVFRRHPDAIVISDVRSLALGTTSPGLNLSVVPSIWMPRISAVA